VRLQPLGHLSCALEAAKLAKRCAGRNHAMPVKPRKSLRFLSPRRTISPRKRNSE
jgi:hypothetical protein